MKKRELRKGGNCYEKAFNFLHETMGDGIKYLLCHGTVGDFETEEGYVEEHGHAWIEYMEMYEVPTLLNGRIKHKVEVWFCIDKSNGHDSILPRDAYYQFGNVKDVHRYSVAEAIRNAIKTGHFGTWHEDDVCGVYLAEENKDDLDADEIEIEDWYDNDEERHFDLVVRYKIIGDTRPSGRVNDKLWGSDYEFIITNEDAIVEVIGRDLTDEDREYIQDEVESHL